MASNMHINIFISLFTDPGPPSNPRLISTSLSPVLLFLSWNHPSQPNGCITGFRYSCHAAGDRSTAVQTQLVGPEVNAVIIDGNGTGLQPMTNYTCKIFALTTEEGNATSVTTGSSSTSESVSGMRAWWACSGCEDEHICIFHTVISLTTLSFNYSLWVGNFSSIFV